MKIKNLLWLALSPLMLSGCIGYNSALFMAKSNVGLDLDTKPPTAEINISRKELVIEPSYEGGKTPPVLASFSSKAGSSGMASFFSGVNQTFAGGDAAVTMAKLYDSKEKVADNETNRARFDSGVQLAAAPQQKRSGWLGLRKLFFGLPDKDAIRPFVFGTDSQFGLKVAWSGTGGGYPDTIKLGYNRKELALAPITITSNNIVRIPSFLATVEHGSEGETITQTNGLGIKTSVDWMQYFATGVAADHLSREYGVRKAMLARADAKALQLSAEEKAGKMQYEQAVNQTTTMVNWATKEGTLEEAKVKTLVMSTELEEQFDNIKKMSPPAFQAKLNGSWSVYVSSLWKNYSEKTNN